MRPVLSRAATARSPLIRVVVGVTAVIGLALSALAAAPAASAAPAEARGGKPDLSVLLAPEVPPDIRAVRWQNNREVQFGIKFPGPDGPFPAPFDRTFDTYLVGNVNLDTPQDPGGVRGGPGGFIWIPPHDDALDPRIQGFRLRALTNGFWVVPSEDAPAGAVLTRETPVPDDLPPNTNLSFAAIDELVYAIKIGNKEIPLTSTARVQLALRLGWVELDDSVGFGGTVWVFDRTPPFDPGPPPGPPPGN